jgi:hypothetical protein
VDGAATRRLELPASPQLGLRAASTAEEHEAHLTGGLMFSTRWLNNNVVIGAIFAVLAVVNAFLLANGFYR